MAMTLYLIDVTFTLFPLLLVLDRSNFYPQTRRQSELNYDMGAFQIYSGSLK